MLRNREVAMCESTTVGPERVDEGGTRYRVDVEDSCAVLVALETGAHGTILSSWATRVRRDDLLTLQIDGTHGSAVAGLHRCWTQGATETPRIAHFNVKEDIGADYRAGWREIPAAGPYQNPYRVGWEQFLRHVIAGEPLSVTRTVTEYVFGPWASVGVQLNTPVTGSMPAPGGFPVPRRPFRHRPAWVREARRGR